MCTIKLSKSTKKQKGFTLLEMAVVLMVFGLIIATAGAAYVQWQTWQDQETTRNNVVELQEKIQDFLSTNGRYPCPASLTADRTDGELYGLEPDPAGANTCNAVVAGNIDLDGDTIVDVYVAAGVRAVERYIDNAGNEQDGGDGPGGALATPQIRIGMVPFRTLGIDETLAYDGHRNRIYYAVTDHMASSIGFDNGTTGSISVVDDSGDNITNTEGDVHFLVFSAGENGLGAFNRQGTQIPCPAAPALENENCDLNDGVFRQGKYSTANTVNAMDDRMAYGVSAIPYFERPVNGDPDDGVTKSASDLGIGGTKENPQEEIDVSGVIRAQDDPSTTSIDEGKIEALSLCDHSQDADCFRVEAIAGSLADGGGMTCGGAGQYIVGIENNGPLCDFVTTGCADDEYIIGIDNRGNAICSGASGNPSCPTTQVPICSTTGTLLFGTHGTSRTVTAGLSRSETYRCDNGTWRRNGSSGLCSCTESDPEPPRPTSCRGSWTACGYRFTGSQIVQTTPVTCPSGGSNTVVLDSSGCACNSSGRRTANPNCWDMSWSAYFPTLPPSGYSYNTGRVNLENRVDCSNPSSPSCTGFQSTGDNCGCVNQTPDPQSKNCTNGYSGKRTRSREFVCVGGGGLGDYGRWTDYTEWDTSLCTCDTTTVTNGLIQCHDAQAGWTPKPSGPGGIRTETRKVDDGTNCRSQTTEIDVLSDVCDPPPPVQCGWQPGGSSSSGTHPTNIVGIPGGCECGSSNAPCSQGSVRYGNCTCDPI